MSEAENTGSIGCLKVSSKSSPASVAGAIAGMIKDGVAVEIQAVGAGAVNQAVKAIAISRGFLSPVGIEIMCVPAFADIAARYYLEPDVEPEVRATGEGIRIFIPASKLR